MCAFHKTKQNKMIAFGSSACIFLRSKTVIINFLMIHAIHGNLKQFDFEKKTHTHSAVMDIHKT